MKSLMFMAIICLLAVSAIYLIGNNEETVQPETNHAAMFQLGVAQISEPRLPTEFDEDTELRVDYNGRTYKIFYSKTIAEGDIGKYFIGGVE